MFHQSVQRKFYKFKEVFSSLRWKARVKTCIRDALAPIDVQRWLLQGRKQKPLGHVPRRNRFWHFQRLRCIRLHRKYSYSHQMCSKSWFNSSFNAKGLNDTFNATIISKVIVFARNIRLLNPHYYYYREIFNVAHHQNCLLVTILHTIVDFIWRPLKYSFF